MAQVKAKAVCLTLREGSEEAGYLAAFYPISTLPSIVVVEYVYHLTLAFRPNHSDITQ